VQTGPGTNAEETIVHIERGRGVGIDSSEVLAVSDAGATLGLTMKWLAPRHLLIILNDDPKYVYHQLLKASGVDISLRYDDGGLRR
jgi:hypothetical protein